MTVNTLANPVIIGLIVAWGMSFISIYVLGDMHGKKYGKAVFCTTVCMQAVAFLIAYGFMRLMGF